MFAVKGGFAFHGGLYAVEGNLFTINICRGRQFLYRKRRYEPAKAGIFSVEAAMFPKRRFVPLEADIPWKAICAVGGGYGATEGDEP